MIINVVEKPITPRKAKAIRLMPTTMDQVRKMWESQTGTFRMVSSEEAEKAGIEIEPDRFAFFDGNGAIVVNTGDWMYMLEDSSHYQFCTDEYFNEAFQ